MYGPLRTPELFAKAAIDPVAHTLVWPNGADFDPATLHGWDEYEKGLWGSGIRMEPLRTIS